MARVVAGPPPAASASLHAAVAQQHAVAEVFPSPLLSQALSISTTKKTLYRRLLDLLPQSTSLSSLEDKAKRSDLEAKLLAATKDEQEATLGILKEKLKRKLMEQGAKPTASAAGTSTSSTNNGSSSSSSNSSSNVSAEANVRDAEAIAKRDKAQEEADRKAQEEAEGRERVALPGIGGGAPMRPPKKKEEEEELDYDDD